MPCCLMARTLYYSLKSGELSPALFFVLSGGAVRVLSGSVVVVGPYTVGDCFF